jgi:hypothetical protein
MSSASKKLMGTTAAGGEALAIEDVFSTYLYTGNGSTQTITNGIDLAGEGGLVWVKWRDGVGDHNLVDSNRGKKVLSSNSTGPEADFLNFTVNAFNSNGFSVGSHPTENVSINWSGNNYASWTFRKAPRFFDVVTWTGNSGTQSISHNLGVAPGAIFVKQTSGTINWCVYHRSQGATKQGILNTTSSFFVDSTWASTEPTDTHFTVGSTNQSNQFSQTYVAYLFAHNDGDGGFGPDGNADIIKCGSYTGNGSTDGPEIDLGFEPQWLMIKRTTSTENWAMYDSMRGMAAGVQDTILIANGDNGESSYAGQDDFDPTATGFKIKNNSGRVNESGNTYIYIAIRRGPMRAPTSGTEVFEPTAYTGNNTTNRTVGSLTVDMNIIMDRTNTSTGLSGYHILFDRVRGADVALKTNSTAPDGDGWSPIYYNLDQQQGFSNGTNTSYLNNNSSSYISYIWKRAPGFFDVVAYSGNAEFGRTIPHNLGVAPDIVILKRRDSTSSNGWPVSIGTNVVPQNFGFYLNSNTGLQTGWSKLASDFTSTTFTVSGGYVDSNANGGTYIAYLFATLAGVSKVGSYTGNGTSQTIDCGFTSGARFILIKRIDSTGDWYVWDTARGIVTGNDPFLKLNTTDAEVTSDDSIDPNSSGFIVNQTATTNVNVSSASYIFLAIA